MVLLILGFFARAEIQHHFVGEESNFEGKTIFTGGEVDIFFNENKVIHSLPIPTYYAMEVAPFEDDWNGKTITPLVDYLKKNNEKVLKITGHFLSEESNVQLGGYENIGEARAGVLKQKLINAGIAAPRILIEFSRINTQTLKQIFNFECYNDSTIIP